MPELSWDRLLSSRRSREFVRSNSNDVRSEFRKDYHRIIGSASFRRLQDKTQVFPLDRGDFVRTRLTHSLEVSSFAGSLADTVFRRLMAEGKSGITGDVREACCDILECAGLVHDIGNPPFGHFGEYMIREWFGSNLHRLSFCGKPVSELLSEQMRGDFLNFEGNAQALRVLTKLHYLIDEHGMNLTYALLNTVIKYPVSSLGIDKSSGNIKDKKMGYFCTESELYGEISSATGAVDCRYPLTFLLEAADDIAYKTADIEDAVKKGMISYAQLLAELTSERYMSRCNDAQREVLKQAADKLSHCRERAVQREMPDPDENAVQNWIVSMQGMLIYSAADAFAENYDLIMHGELKRELLACSSAAILAEALSDIAYRYAFTSKEILGIELSVETMLSFLLEKLTGAALRFDTPQRRITDDKLISVISPNYLKVCRTECEGKPPAQQAYHRLMLVTDYICGMTDGFARELYRGISGIS
ncbi:MAG: deoxyguanosinetriphosphate triphosphohydrolase [Oscillospiraceae bacterium]